MQDSKQIISISPNWNHIHYVGDSITIPNEQMLIELIRPGCDPESTTVHWLAEDEIDKILDRESYLVARKWNNSRIISMCTHSTSIENPYGIDEISSLIIQLCSDHKLDWQEPLYHLAVTRYINLMFPGKLLPSIKKILPHFQALNNNFRKYGWDGFSELAEKSEMEESRSNAKSLLGKRYIHSSELEQRFPDYRLANDYLDDFYSYYLYGKDALVLAFLGGLRDRLVNFNQDTKIDTISKQCPYCNKWFDITKFGNGKLKHRCDNCEREYDRVRKPKKRGGNGKQQNPNKKREVCKGCGKKRLLYEDSRCNECLNR